MVKIVKKFDTWLANFVFFIAISFGAQEVCISQTKCSVLFANHFNNLTYNSITQFFENDLMWVKIEKG